MHNEAVVILERDAALPSWIDAELGADSSIFICSEQPQEEPAAFAERVTKRVEQGQFPRRARFCVLVVDEATGRERTLARGALLISLWELGRVIVLSRCANPSLEQLVAMYDAELRVEQPEPGEAEAPASVRRVA